MFREAKNNMNSICNTQSPAELICGEVFYYARNLFAGFYFYFRNFIFWGDRSKVCFG